MRHAVSNKLRSQRGASLLLALLFLLICSMVAASILMAAAANVGKSRSNLSEHQTYLALSSAVSLLCDELSAAEYQAQYTCWVTEEPTGDVDDEGNPTYTTVHHFAHVPGTYSGRLSSILLPSFDAIFARTISGAPVLSGYVIEESQSTTVPATHTLTLTPDTGTELDEQEITVKLEVQSSYAMYLTATLNGYTIKAELTPIQTELVLPPALEIKGPSQIQSVGPMQWKIGWITTGGEEDEP